MLTTGQIVEVEVTSIFCSFQAQDLLVRIPETSWIASFASCKQFAEPGDQLTVKIIHVDSTEGEVSASIKALHPDPWGTDALVPGTVHKARLVRYVAQADRCHDGAGYLLELVPGGYVMLCAEGHSIDQSQPLTVTVRESSHAKRAVRVVAGEDNLQIRADA
jgi:hypothetical protein